MTNTLPELVTPAGGELLPAGPGYAPDAAPYRVEAAMPAPIFTTATEVSSKAITRPGRILLPPTLAGSTHLPSVPSERSAMSGNPYPAYYRHRNDDFKHEIVVRAFVPGEGDLWGFTVTGDEGGFDPLVAVHVRTDQFMVYARFPEFFAALAERRPGTLDEVVGILDALGVVDDTAGYQQRRAQTTAALDAHFDSFNPWREGWEGDG
ncbi:hypothetical protein ACFV1N_25325 [Streptosporangium canum]|uniref:hypothetical protein n=1 Tax=Streptosporangium canum TaxID=324952 RepID=UPI00368FE0EE